MTMPVLTIDGPSGAGKGTVSRRIAKQLGWHYLDSGSIYRALAIAIQLKGIAVDDVSAIVATAATMRLAFALDDELIVLLNDEDITGQLPLEETGNAASKIAVLPEVRQALLQKQRDFKQLPGLVADGRDMGTVVFPEASKKVFLTASSEKRAERRYKQLKEKGINANLVSLAKDIEERDRRDRERATAPLSLADDALFIDSSDMTIDAVINTVLQFVHE